MEVIKQLFGIKLTMAGIIRTQTVEWFRALWKVFYDRTVLIKCDLLFLDSKKYELKKSIVRFLFFLLINFILELYDSLHYLNAYQDNNKKKRKKKEKRNG